MSDDKTLPPVKAAARGFVAGAINWITENPGKAAVILLVVAAFVIGRCSA